MSEPSCQFEALIPFEDPVLTPGAPFFASGAGVPADPRSPIDSGPVPFEAFPMSPSGGPAMPGRAAGLFPAGGDLTDMDTYRVDRQRLEVFASFPDLPVIPGFTSMLDLYGRRRAGRRLPARRDIDLGDMEEWAGWMNISRSTDEGPVYTLFGSQNVELFGVEMTGKALSDYVDEPYRTDLIAFFRTLAEARAIGLISGQSVLARKSWLLIRTLILPLGTDGETVDRFMHLVMRMPEEGRG